MKVMWQCCPFFYHDLWKSFSCHTRHVVWLVSFHGSISITAAQTHIHEMGKMFARCFQGKHEMSKRNRLPCTPFTHYSPRLWSFLYMLFTIYVPLEVSQVKWFWVILDLGSDIATLCTSFFLVLKTEWIDFPLGYPSVVLLSFAPSHAR